MEVFTEIELKRWLPVSYEGWRKEGKVMRWHHVQLTNANDVVLGR